jgi:prepilin-type N-terminal cleavage/methylation domain-containing protein
MQAAGNTYPQNKDAIQSKDGFTLVEVIVSMFLMAIVFTAAFGTYFLGMRMVEDAREEIRASQIIQSELEAMRTLTWDDLENKGTGWSIIDPQGNFVQQFAKDYLAYRWVYNINSEQKRIAIWVRWTNSRGEYTYQMFSTIFTKNGLNDYYYSSPT